VAFVELFFLFVAFFVAMNDVDAPPISSPPTTVQASSLLDVNGTIGDVHGSTLGLPVSESAAHGDARPASTAGICEPTPPESAHGILESLFEGNSAPLVAAIHRRLLRLQRTDLQAMNEIALKMLVIAILHEALERTEGDNEAKQEAKDECAEAKDSGPQDDDRDRFRYHLQSEPEAVRYHAETGCEKLGFIDLVIERSDTRALRFSDNYRTAMILELKYLALTCLITDPSAAWFQTQYFMRPVQAGIELERRKALHLAWDESTFMAQRFQRLDSKNSEFKRLACTDAFDPITCTHSKTKNATYPEKSLDTCTLPVSAWLELARLQAASYRLIQSPARPVLRWAIVAVGALAVARPADVVPEPSLSPSAPSAGSAHVIIWQ
jgi:hypothetical protein